MSWNELIKCGASHLTSRFCNDESGPNIKPNIKLLDTFLITSLPPPTCLRLNLVPASSSMFHHCFKLDNILPRMTLIIARMSPSITSLLLLFPPFPLASSFSHCFLVKAADLVFECLFSRLIWHVKSVMLIVYADLFFSFALCACLVF
jgi:hypothetical protein